MAGIDQYTKLLYHFDGTDASTTFTDSSGNGYNGLATGSAQLDTAQAKFGVSSYLSDGNSDAITFVDSDDFHFASGNWTIDFWIRFSDVTPPLGYQVIYSDGYHDSLTGQRSLLMYQVPGELHIAQSNDGTDNTDVGRSWTGTENVWYHFAVVRDGSAVKIFVDGTQIGTDITAIDLKNGSYRKIIGAQHPANTNASIFGWVDEFRISKGIARWTGNFTPPTEEYSEEVPLIVYQKLQMIL